MNTTEPLSELTASDLMSGDVITIPQDCFLRAAAELLFRNQIGGAPVVDPEGRCIGMLSATDFVRWVKDGAQGAEEVPPPPCPYQVKGRLLTGGEALICTLSEGYCPLQELWPTTGGSHTTLCLLPEGAARDPGRAARNSLVRGVCRAMTADLVTVAAEAPLAELVRFMIDAHVHRLVVVDGQHRPIGIVSCIDVLAALARSASRAEGSDGVGRKREGAAVPG
jgi:CBS-domain-containing membrane protein